MDRKGHLLSHLKKQVISLRNQLERITHAHPSKLSQHSHLNSRHNQSASHSHSPRFDSNTYDSTYLERGIRKFPLQDSKFKNIAQIIQEKSKAERTPRLSSQRRAEIERTKENFSTEMFESVRSKSRSPNPVTGEGYSSKKEGRKLVRLQKTQQADRASERRHFFTYDHY